MQITKRCATRTWSTSCPPGQPINTTIHLEKYAQKRHVERSVINGFPYITVSEHVNNAYIDIQWETPWFGLSSGFAEH